MNISFNEEEVWNQEGIVDLVEGSTEVFSATFWATVTGTPTLACLKNGQTVSSTVFPSGSVTVSDKTVTFKPAVFGSHGTYVITCTATVGSNTKVKKVQVRVQKAKAIR